MAKPSMDVDRVVREVLAELTGATAGLPGSAGGGLHGKPLPDKPAVPPEEPVPPGELVINTRVVTLSEVEGRLESVRRLVVPPRAVITPAVRDELIRRNVTVAYASADAARATAPVRLVLAAAGKHFDPAPLVGALIHEGIEVDQRSSDCLIAATDALAGEIVEPDTLGLLLTRHTAAGLCLANRLRGVRAVLATDPAAASAAAGSVGANLLVVDPSAASPFQLKQITTKFCQAGTRQCPEIFKERLS